MSVSTLLRTALTNHTGVHTRVGSRIYPLLLPEHPTYDAITYQRIDNVWLAGSNDIRETRYQLSCWATTYLGAQALTVDVKDALEGYQDRDQSPSILDTRIENEIDDYDETVKAFRTIVDVILLTTGD
jgi:hypothetical protein